VNQVAVRNHSLQDTSPPGHNLLLRAFSADDLKNLAPHLEYIDMPVPYLLHEQSKPIQFAYFLDSGIGSFVTQFTDGDSVETGIGGRESVWGASLAAGVDNPPGRSFMQVAGTGFRLRKDAFVDCGRNSRSFLDVILRATYLEQVQARQIAACNARHEIAERLARWLLMCDDRLRCDPIVLTHEFLALMLGTRRSSVTLAAGSLQEAGLIRYTRRAIHITNRAELEQASCPCYAIVAEEYRRVIGLDPRRDGNHGGGNHNNS
jgi:CRP-like cAMP-binding protein